MTENKSETRGHEHALEIAAPPEVVWRAITEAEELVRWFPLGAQTRPGRDGKIVYRWGDLVGQCRIVTWDPPRHLRTGWMEAPAADAEAPAFPRTATLPDAARAQLLVDWFLEGRGGKTVLRLVHSGFGRDAQWDQEYEGTRRGWDFELQALKHYLERQRGKTRRAFWLRQPVRLPAQEVWERFRRPGVFFRSVQLESLGVGDRYRFERQDGEVLEGRVLVHSAPLEFAGTADTLGDGMIRFGFEDCMGGPEAHVWIATWGLSEKDAAALEARWQQDLRRTFAG